MANRAALQRAVLSLQRLPPLRALFRLYYRAGAAVFALNCRLALPEVKEIFLRRGQTEAGWVPGASDLDFAVIVEDLDDARLCAFLRRFWRLYDRWKRVLPILGETQIVSRREAERLKGRAGFRLREYGAAPDASDWKGRWECLGEAVFSGLNLLEQTYFDGTAGPDFGHKIAKGFLDALRYSEAGRSSQAAAAPVGRLERLRQLEPGPLKETLSRPLSMPREEAKEVCCRALTILDAACAEFLSDAQRLEPLDFGERPRWEPPLAGSELLLWRRRLKLLDHPQYPPIRGAYYDGMERWHIVSDVAHYSTLSRLFDQVEAWHREDPAFRAPPWVVSENIFQLLLWTPHLGTPLFWLALSPHVGPSGVAARPKSGHRLGSWADRVQWKITADQFRAPPKAFVDYGFQQSLSELSLSLGLFARGGWGGDNAYRIYRLYGRLMSASLYLRAGLAHDPEDLDGLIRRFSERFPAEHEKLRGPLEAALALRPQELNERPEGELFYQHLPGYRALLEGALGALSSSKR